MRTTAVESNAMADAGNKAPPARFSVQRWSQRKLEAAREQSAVAPVPAEVPQPELPRAADAGTALSVAAPLSADPRAPELPAPETLTFESDFTAFLQPKVEEALKRRALKRLFRDPRFNVMDGLDVYIDDYSVPSPVSPEILREMAHARLTLDPPKTRVNAAGWVEDVPPEPTQAQSAPGEPLAPDASSGTTTSTTAPVAPPQRNDDR